MAFKVTITGLDEFSKHQFVTEVVIERHIYEHSRARITLQWDEHTRYNDRQTASIAAKALNCTVDVQWKDNDLAESTDCFHGYVERVSGERDATKSRFTLECISFSKRTDLIPRYRAFQACQMLDICNQIIKTEPLFKIDQSGDLSFDIELSLQYAETDFAYLCRMLHAYGLPMSVIDKTGDVMLGARGTASSGQFPDVHYGWTQVAFKGALEALPKRTGGGSGPTSSARGQVDTFNGQLKTTAADYYPIPDSQPIRERVSAVNSLIDTSCYHLQLEGAVLPFAPGEVVKFENQDHIIRAVKIVGHPMMDSATQEFVLQTHTLPYHPDRRVPVWPSRTVWAHVVDNEKDPWQSGRIQVKFEFESLDPQSSSEKAWLHTLTPYGGGKSPSDGKAGEYNGFYSLPEVGERVLVEFLGDWDSEAVVIGTVREKAVNPKYNPKDTKRWRTPSGNEITLTTKGSTEVVRLRCKDKIFFESKMDGPNATVYITPGESDGDIIHFEKGAGPPQLYIMCGGNITVQAQQKLHLEGQMVQIKASGGNVNIDGAPNVMINCVPMPAMPLQKQLFEEEKLTTSTKTRTLPSPIGTTAASGSSASQDADSGDDSQSAQKKQTWIEIVLKNQQTGAPIPNERYRLKLPDGSIREGRLDSEGRARVDGIDPGSAQVSFPDIDSNDWKPA